MIEKLKRVYVYESDYLRVLGWAKLFEVRAPNKKQNFPFFLREFLKEE